MHLMRDVQDRWLGCEAMLATLANYATRVTNFIVAANALSDLSACGSQAFDRRSTTACTGTPGRDIVHIGNNEYDRTPHLTKRQRRELQWSDQQGSEAQAIVWGSATQHGIHMEPDGKRIKFGKVICSFANPVDVVSNCPACYAPGKGRDKWCPTPDKCWAQCVNQSSSIIRSPNV